MPNPATAKRGKKKLRIGRLSRLVFSGIDPQYLRSENVAVYNEYEDMESNLQAGNALHDGDQIIAENSTLDVITVEAYDPVEGGAAEVIIYDQTQDYIEVDMTYFDSFEEFYDEEGDLTYDASDYSSVVGIRG